MKLFIILAILFIFIIQTSMFVLESKKKKKMKKKIIYWHITYTQIQAYEYRSFPSTRFQSQGEKIQLGTYESDECPATLNVKYAIIILWLGRHLATNHFTEIVQKIKVMLTHTTGNKILDGAHYLWFHSGPSGRTACDYANF